MSRCRPRSALGWSKRASSTSPKLSGGVTFRPMQVGLIGAGNMARALARGWGDPVLVSDAGSGRAAELARELGGEALRSNVEVADRADLVVLCHKPAQWRSVARELRGHATAVASVVGGV